MRGDSIRIAVLPDSQQPTSNAQRGQTTTLGELAIGSWELGVGSCTMPLMAECDPSPVAQAPVANKSGRMVQCVKFQKELPGLDAPPWPGELGQRIYEGVSAQAWKLWEERMKM